MTACHHSQIAHKSKVVHLVSYMYYIHIMVILSHILFIRGVNEFGRHVKVAFFSLLDISKQSNMVI